MIFSSNQSIQQELSSIISEGQKSETRKYQRLVQLTTVDEKFGLVVVVRSISSRLELSRDKR